MILKSTIFLYVLLFLTILVFMEFIEHNFCGLQKEIKWNIQERVLTETPLNSEKNILDYSIDDEE